MVARRTTDALGALAALADALVPHTCAACDAPSMSFLCAPCAETVERAPPAADGTIGCVLFGGAVADAVRAAKFGRDAVVAEGLARLFAQRLATQQCESLPSVDVVTFVPAPYRRRLARGFDLPAVIGDALARQAHVPLVDALACTRTDAPLSFGADKVERAVRVSGRYRARRSFAAVRMLLVDDVRTTGATLAEAASALRAAGAVVTPVALAIAP